MNDRSRSTACGAVSRCLRHNTLFTGINCQRCMAEGAMIARVREAGDGE